MKITVISEDDQFKEVDFFEDSLVSDVKEVLQIEFGIQVEEQDLFANNVVLLNDKLINHYCKDQDMIRLTRKLPNYSVSRGGAGQNRNNTNSFTNNNASQIANQLSSLFGNTFSQSIHEKYLQQARQFKQQIKATPYLLDNLKAQNKDLAAIIQTGSDNDLAHFLQKQDEEKIKKKLQEQKELEELEKDPFNSENQKKIQEIIYQKQIDENLEMAQEYIPEVFGKITMLYIDVTINQHAIQAFVDTGAESTIMSKDCAERCGLMRLVDTRFSGMASGVGTGKILGRIHKYSIQILDQVDKLVLFLLRELNRVIKKRIECSFTVLESINLDFLLGLDNMKRFQVASNSLSLVKVVNCCVSLRENSLNFMLGEKELKVPFLPEKDIKKTVSIAEEQKLFDEEEKRKLTSEQQSKAMEVEGSSQIKEQNVTMLMQNLGVSRQQATEALQNTNGNLELAGSILANKQF